MELTLNIDNLERVCNADTSGDTGWYHDADTLQYYRLNMKRKKWSGRLPVDDLPTIEQARYHKKQKAVDLLHAIDADYNVDKLDRATRPSHALMALTKHKEAHYGNNYN